MSHISITKHAFSLEDAKARAALVTRAGVAAIMLAYVPGPSESERVIAVTEEGRTILASEDGKASDGEHNDLFIAVSKVRRYANIYAPNSIVHAMSPRTEEAAFYPTAEQARSMAGQDALAVAVPIDVPV